MDASRYKDFFILCPPFRQTLQHCSGDVVLSSVRTLNFAT